jgi:hypothetical protein
MSSQSNQSNGLTIKYLINLLNDQTSLKINRQQYLIDSFPTLKVESNLTYDNLLSCLMITYKNISYNINEVDLRIGVSTKLVKDERNIIQKYIYDSALDNTKKKKYINAINTLTNPTNESILVLTYFYGLNLLIYNTESQTIKCYYWDNHLDRDLPFVLLKETKETNSPNLYYEIVFSQNKFIFDYTHPIIQEMIPNAFIVGLEQNKKLEFLEIEKVSDVLENIFNETKTDSNSDVIAVSNYDNENIYVASETDLKPEHSTQQKPLNLMKNSRQTVTIKLIPESVLKRIEEFQTMNLKPLII